MFSSHSCFTHCVCLEWHCRFTSENFNKLWNKNFISHGLELCKTCRSSPLIICRWYLRCNFSEVAAQFANNSINSCLFSPSQLKNCKSSFLRHSSFWEIWTPSHSYKTRTSYVFYISVIDLTPSYFPAALVREKHWILLSINDFYYSHCYCRMKESFMINVTYSRYGLRFVDARFL